MRFTHLVAALLTLGTAASARAESSTTISGKAFVDYTYRDNKNDGTSLAADKLYGTALDLKRFYLGVDQNFDGVWRARIRTDVGNLTNGKVDVFVKHAFVEGRFSDALDLKAGAADLPWVPFVEDLYGFRYVENVLIDRVKLGTSADWGLHLGGKLAGGLVDYAVSAVNGRGYGDPTRTQTPTVEARLGVFPVKGLTISVAGQTGKLGQNAVAAVAPATSLKDAQRADALVAWVDGGLRLGVTGFYAKNYDKAIVTGASPADKAVGFSGWGSYQFAPEYTVFARADSVQPKKDTNSALKDVYFNAGVQYVPVKPLAVSLVYKQDTVKGGTLATANGTIGSAVAGAHGTYTEVGLFAQYSF